MTKYRLDALAQCARIRINHRHAVYPYDIDIMYHFELTGGQRGLQPRSTPFWLALGKRLVDFFGGRVDFCDADDREADYVRDKPRTHNDPKDGTPWERFQQELFTFAPLTREEIEACQEFAAYEDGGAWK